MCNLEQILHSERIIYKEVLPALGHEKRSLKCREAVDGFKMAMRNGFEMGVISVSTRGPH